MPKITRWIRLTAKGGLEQWTLSVFRMRGQSPHTREEYPPKHYRDLSYGDLVRLQRLINSHENMHTTLSKSGRAEFEFYP
jgi:hypothetical protein